MSIKSCLSICILCQVCINITCYVLPNLKSLDSRQSLSPQIYLFNRFFGKSEEVNIDYDVLPMAVIVSGLKYHELETIDNVVFNVTGKVPPVFILGSGKDVEMTLSDILLSKNFFQSRDHEIPERPFLSEYPVMLISGCEQKITLDIVKLLKFAHNSNSDLFPKCLFAVAVKPALNKSMRQLLDEIIQDYKMTLVDRFGNNAQDLKE